MKLIILLSSFMICYGHWMCELAGITCSVADGEERIFSKTGGSYVDSFEVFNTDRLLDCANFCRRKNCYYLLLLTDHRCVIAFGKSEEEKHDGYFIAMRSYENIALGKPVHVVSTWPNGLNLHDGFYAVDGQIEPHNHMFVSGKDETTPWFIVDLGDMYQIAIIRVIGRQKSPDYDRFLDVDLMVGELLDNSGHFVSYTKITRIANRSNFDGIWFVVSIDLPDKYQYVALQRKATTGLSVLEISELEVYTKKTN